MNKTAAFSILFFAIVGCDKNAAKSVHNYRPETRIARVQLNQFVHESLESVWDFASVNGKIYTLDWHGRGVDVLSFRDGAWRVVARFSRSGNGPGEITEPVSLDFDSISKSIVIGERSGELEFFDTTGNYQRSSTINLPCAAAHIQFLGTFVDQLVGQRCFGGRFVNMAADTAYMLVARVAVGKQPQILSSHATSNQVGDWGTIYTSEWPLSITRDTVYFASGTNSCIYRAALKEPIVFRAWCNKMVEFASDAPEHFDDKRIASKASKWPNPLPPFLWMTAIRDRPVVIRVLSADSVGFALESHPEEFFLIAPFNSLVNCDATGCLWFDNREEPQRMAFYSSASLDSLIQASVSRK